MGDTGFYSRRAGWILLVCALAAPVLFYGAARAVQSNNNKVEDWLPSGFNETVQLQWFRDHFITDQFIIISWEGCHLGGDPSDPQAEPDDPRIAQVANMLRGLGRPKTADANAPADANAADPNAPAANGQLNAVQASVEKAAVEPKADGQSSEAPAAAAGPPAAEPIEQQGYFRTVMTARQLLNELTNAPSNVPYDLAKQRLNGTLIGPDGKQTCVVVTLSDKGAKNLRQAIGRGTKRGPLKVGRPPGELFKGLAACGITGDMAHLGGPPIDNVAIDEEGERTLVRLAGLSLLLGLGLAWWSLRSIKLTAIVFVCGILSAALGLAMVWWTGNDMDAVLLSMPSLVYVLAISGAVHLVNYYRDEVLEHGQEGAVSRAMAHGWKPALLCSVTTAIGLFSLCASEIEPIRKFGLYSALGVIGMLAILFVYLPAALVMWPVRFKRTHDERGVEDEHSLPDQPHSLQDKFWCWFGSTVIRHHALVFMGCMAVIGLLAGGLTRINTSIDLLKMFDSSARILKDYVWLEQNLGRLIPMEVVIRFPESMQQELSRQPQEPLVADRTSNGSGERLVSQQRTIGEPESEGGESGVRTARTSVDLTKGDPGVPTFLERMEFVSIAQTVIEKYLGQDGRNLVGKTMSAATFAPELPDGKSGAFNIARRAGTNEKMLAAREGFQRSGYLRTAKEDGSELWRISLRVAAFENLDYGQFTSELSQVLEPVLAARQEFTRLVNDVAMLRPAQRRERATVVLWQQPPTDTESPQAIREQQIFFETLTELFKRKRFQVVTGEKDPDVLTDAELKGLPNVDAVVLVGGFSNEHRQRISQMVGPVVTAMWDAGLPKEPTEDNQLAAMDPLTRPELSAVYTGVVPIVYKTQRVLLNSLVDSTIWSFATIMPLMMFVCRSIPAGAVVMLPNVLPVVMVFGTMGWLGIKVDIGSMMSASIALGVAVDDTIHFLSWFRGDLDRLRDRRKATLIAYRRCAPPTLQAALISGLGLSVFAFSTFTPTQRFGWLMLTILLTGVVAELVMLPSILAGPLGRVFRPRNKPLPAGSH
ncbi:MAG: MMPL family transporter [Pirellulales bacterium]